MPKSKQSLNDLLHEVRRIEQHREKLSEKQIQKIYKQLLKETNSFIADYYNKYSNGDGQLTVAMLQEKNKYAKFLEEIEKNINTLTPEASKEILSTVEKTYTACYQGMVDAVEKSKNTADLAQSMQGIQVRPETLKRAVLNPVSGLTLPDVLEKNRKAVIYDVKQVLNIGLMNGDRYDTMAKKLTEKYDMSYRKAVTISRTETHRVQEGGFFDCAADISSGLEGSELIYAATWRTMKDERVRPQRAKYKRKAGVKARKQFTAGLRSYIGSGYANHMKMEGVTVKVGNLFDLGNGVKTVAPAQSGDAGNDCNCRCYLEYDLMTVEEFAKATGQSAEKVRDKYFEVSPKQAVSDEMRQYMNDNGVVDLDLQNTSNSQRFKDAEDEARRTNPHGGSVDPHEVEELNDYNLILSSDGMAGVAVKPDGDITAVFKNSNSSAQGAVNDLILTARENGGTKMDCYGQFLANSYEKCGYTPVARVPFNAAYVNDEYLLKTKPDVYILMKNTDSIETAVKKNATKAYKVSSQKMLDDLPTFIDYDEGMAYRDWLLGEQAKGKVIDAAAKHYAKAIAKEPNITATLKKTVKNTDASMAGLKYRLKTTSSYNEKVGKEIIDLQKSVDKLGIKYTITQAEATNNMRDVVRYTCLSDKENFITNYNQIVKSLEKQNYKVVRVKNTFKPNAPYKGVNTIVEDADGYQFELQFHTPQSFRLKNGILHKLYEKERKVTTPPAEKVLLQKRMKEISDTIVFPNNITDISTFNELTDIIDKIAKM